jgi:hypothetical protein
LRIGLRIPCSHASDTLLSTPSTRTPSCLRSLGDRLAELLQHGVHDNRHVGDLALRLRGVDAPRQEPLCVGGQQQRAERTREARQIKQVARAHDEQRVRRVFAPKDRLAQFRPTRRMA